MATDLSAAAKKRGIKYFLISYTDLYGTQRAKLVPAAAIVFDDDAIAETLGELIRVEAVPRVTQGLEDRPSLSLPVHTFHLRPNLLSQDS